MIEQVYNKGLKHTHAYTVDDTTYHSCIVSDISERPIIDYKAVYIAQNCKRANEILQQAMKKLEEKDEDSALHLLDHALNLHPKNALALTKRGCIHYNRGFLVKAYSDFLAVPTLLSFSFTDYITNSPTIIRHIQKILLTRK